MKTDRLGTAAGANPVTEKLTTQTVFSNGTLHVDRDQVRLPDDTVGSFTTVTEGTGKGVLVVPVTPFHHGPHIGLARNYRHPVRDFSLELPRGARSTLSADEAAHELMGTTGLSAARLELLGIIHPDTSILTNEVAVWYARTATAASLPDSSASATGADLHWFSYGEVLGLQRRGHITCSLTLAALSLLNASGFLNTPH